MNSERIRITGVTTRRGRPGEGTLGLGGRSRHRLDRPAVSFEKRGRADSPGQDSNGSPRRPPDPTRELAGPFSSPGAPEHGRVDVGFEIRAGGDPRNPESQTSNYRCFNREHGTARRGLDPGPPSPADRRSGMTLAKHPNIHEDTIRRVGSLRVVSSLGNIGLASPGDSARLAQFPAVRASMGGFIDVRM